MLTVSFKLNQNRRHHIPRQRHKVTNWSDYEASLRQRGSLTVWFTEDAIAAWAAEPRTTRGGQPWYSPLAILTALTLRAVFRLAFRQTEGLIGSVVGPLGLALRVPDHTTLCGRPRSATDFAFTPAPCGASRANRRFAPGVWGPLLGRASRPKPDPCRPSRHRRLALLKGPVRCALMSGLSRGRCRWPSWVCARVPGTNLSRALEAQRRVRCRLGCLDHSLSHHAAQRFLPDQPDSRPSPSTVRRNITPRLPQRPRHVPSPGRPPRASSTPKRCAPSCSRAPRSPA
jgi:hypothetical protein